MSTKPNNSPRIVRLARSHLRLWISIALGVAVMAALPATWRLATRLLIGWDIGVLFYLVLVAAMMARSTVTELRLHAAAQDEGARALLALIVVAAMASLGAIFAELAAIDRVDPGYGLYVALAIGTVVLSWTFTHTIFALHYAYEFYGDRNCANGLRFPDDDTPDYWDFIYFSFVIGMTFQVSDVAVTNKLLRRMVVAHGALSFFFTTAIVALTVNIAANVIQR
jgi:uncharacterized membrane protein